MNTIRLRFLTVLTAVAALLAAGLLAPAAASAHAAYCGQVWGSTPESRIGGAAGQFITSVRAGRHACFDRIVIDVGGPAVRAQYDVRYVDAVHQPGSGYRVPLEGGADLQVVMVVPTYKDWVVTYDPEPFERVVDVSGFRTVKQVALAGSYEGRTTFGIGTRARLPFRTFTLLGAPGSDQQTRLVIDIGHRW